MKIALYRKYRSKRFADVIGQEAAATALKNQIRSGKLGHSYIFTGIRGTGKTSFARILAKAVNCPNAQDGEPCGECEICCGIDDGSILDVTEIDAASNSGVDNIRDLRDETAYAPAVCKMRVYIIDEVHMLTKEAFNALLKIMEEPPAHVLFILATTEIHKVPATILSRCQRFDLKRISQEDIAAHLLHVASLEQIDLTEQGAALIARLADGAMRDALSILDTCASLGETVDEQTVARLTGLANKDYLFALAQLLQSGDLSGIFVKLGELYENSLDATRLCTELIRHVRNLLMVRLAGKAALRDCSNEEVERYKQQSAQFETDRLLWMLRVMGETADKLGNATDRMLLVELMFVRLCGQQPAEPPERIQASVPQTKPVKAAEKPAAQPAHEMSAPAGAVQSTSPVDTAPGAAVAKEIQQKPANPHQAVLLESWPQVVASLQAKSGMLYAFLADSRAYLTKTHVLIEAQDIFMKYVRDHADAKDLIKKALLEAAGISLPIGPYDPQKYGAVQAEPVSAAPSPLDELIERARESGVEVEIRE